MDERHTQATAALASMLREAHQVLDMERNEYIDIARQVVTVRTVLDEYRAALAAATERAEANATEVHILGERVRIECERRDQARRERDAANARADALAARLREVEG